MKRIVSICFLALFFMLMISPIVFARNEQYTTEIRDEGYPYDQPDKYNYSVNSVWEIPKENENGDFVCQYEITVMDKQFKVLSDDILEIVVSGLPKERDFRDTHKLELYFPPFERDSKQYSDITLRKEIKTRFTITQAEGFLAQKSWEENKADTKSARDFFSFEERTFIGRPALFGTVENEEGDGIKRQYRGITQLITVYFDEIVISDHIFVFNIWWEFSVDNEDLENISAYSERPEYQDRLADFLNEFDTVYQKNKAKADSIIEAFQNASLTIRHTYGIRIYDDDKEPGGAFVVDMDAPENAGAVSVAVAAIVVLGGLAAGAAGAAAAGGDENEKESGSYSMVIYKDFGNKIKYNADAVYVYAKMVETTPDGREIDRPDLTGQIDIFSGNPSLLEMSACAMTGEYMGAGIIGGPGAVENTNADAVISFRFTGAGGTFQNNVTFKVIGKEYVSLEAEKIMVFAASGKSFELPYELMNFAAEPDEITVNAIQGGNALFDLALGVNEHQKPVIIATDKAPREASVKSAFDSFSCEIIAKNSKEYARTVFTVVMCHEGLTAAFPHTRGEEPSVELNSDGEARSAVAFYFYLWDDGQKTLAAHPQALETLTLTRAQSDDLLVRNAAEVSGLGIEYDKPYTQDGVLYSVTTERPFPSNRPHVVIGMEAAINYGGERYTCAFTVKLITVDTSPGSASWDEEYQKLKKIIDKIVPLKHRVDFYNMINSKKHELDAPGLVVLRRMLVGKACELNERLARGYLNDAAWYDTAVKVCEYLEVAGDVAMSALTTAFLGPLAGVGADMIRQYIMSAVKAQTEGLSVEVWFNNEVKGIVPMLSAMGMGMMTDPQTIEYALGRSMKTQVVAWGVYFGYNFYNEMYNNKKSLYEAAKSTAFIFGKRVAVKYLAGRLSQSWAAQKIDSLKAKIKSEGGLSKQDMLDIMQDSQFVRSIKNSGDVDLQNAFNQSLRQHVYAPHDTALLHWLQKQPQLEGREVRIDDFTTPGKQSAVNTDRDYRVLMKSGNDWVEVPTDMWKNKSYQIFSERTGFDTQSAYKTLGVEKQIWDKMPPEAQREMWANKNYRQLATDRTHAEACADFSDQNPEGIANITKVKAGKSTLQDAKNMGRMYENKVIGELLGNQNKTEALAQLQKGYQELIEMREGYAKQDIKLPHMDDKLTAGVRDLKSIPSDLSAGNQPHFVKDDTILDMAARLRAEIARMGTID